MMGSYWVAMLDRTLVTTKAVLLVAVKGDSKVGPMDARMAE
jgi:hypothetical protein